MSLYTRIQMTSGDTIVINMDLVTETNFNEDRIVFCYAGGETCRIFREQIYDIEPQAMGGLTNWLYDADRWRKCVPIESAPEPERRAE